MVSHGGQKLTREPSLAPNYSKSPVRIVWMFAAHLLSVFCLTRCKQRRQTVNLSAHARMSAAQDFDESAARTIREYDYQ